MPQEGKALMRAAQHIYSTKWLMSPAIAILIVEVMRMKYAKHLRVLVFFISLLYFGYQIWIGQRSGVIGVGLLLLASYYLPDKKFNKLKMKKVILISFIILICAGFVSKFRGEVYLGSTFEDLKDFINKPLSTQLSELFIALPTGGGSPSWYGAEITMYMNYLRVIPAYVDYDYGEFYLGLLTHWIPRIIWHNKPYLGERKKGELESVIGTSHVSGPAVTMLGMYYLHFGIPGVLIGMFLTGIFLGAIENWWKFNCDNYGVLLIYLMVFTLGLSVIGNGFLAGIHFWFPFYVLPVIIGLIYLRFRYKKVRANTFVLKSIAKYE